MLSTKVEEKIPANEPAGNRRCGLDSIKRMVTGNACNWLSERHHGGRWLHGQKML